MANLTISSAASLTGATTASGDLFPCLDVSAASGSQGSKITRDELGDAMTRTAAMIAALAAKLDLAGGTMTGALVLNPTTGAPLTVRRNSKTCLEVTNGEQINIGRYDGVWGSGSASLIGWNGMYGAGSWVQGGAGNWYATFQFGAGTGEFRIASDVGGTNAVRLFNASAASLQIGANHATTSTDQTIKAHNVTTGTGASLVLAGGTGSVAGGTVKLAASTTTGSPNTLIEVMPSDQLAFFGTGGSTQPNTGIAGESHVAGSGTAVTEDSTFGGYTLMQIIAGLRALGLFQ